MRPINKFAGALVDAQVDLNPHQVQAALFAFQNPLSGGALLADEVGLGKTIEAGLVIAQKWAEYKRRILIVTPADLRKQWVQEKARVAQQWCAEASRHAARTSGKPWHYHLFPDDVIQSNSTLDGLMKVVLA